MVLGNGEGKPVAVEIRAWDERKKKNSDKSEQTYSNSITGESSDKYLSVKDKAKFFKSLQEENAVAEGLKEIKQQFNGQFLGQYDTTCSDGQTSLDDSIINNDSGISTPTEENIRKELVESLKEHERDINAQDENGWTRLHYAAANNDGALVKLLIECGADLNVQDKRGYTPLCYALAYRNCDDREVVTYLVRSGASISDQNTNIDKHKISRPKQSEAAPSHSKKNNVIEVQEKSGKKLKAKLKKLCSQLKDKKGRNRSTDKINIELDRELKQVEKKLEKAQEDLERLKVFLTENETRLEAFNKLGEENESLKQKIQDLENENATLNSESSKTETNEVSLKKAEKKPPLSEITYVSLVATSIVGSILSVVSGLFVLSIITTSITSALIAGGIAYKMSQPATELKEPAIQNLVQRGV